MTYFFKEIDTYGLHSWSGDIAHPAFFFLGVTETNPTFVGNVQLVRFTNSPVSLCRWWWWCICLRASEAKAMPWDASTGPSAMKTTTTVLITDPARIFFFF